MLLRYTEEALAETVGTGSIMRGLAFPMQGYGISYTGLAVETTMYGGVILGSGQLLRRATQEE